ncbi:hypothetical protein MMC26_001025 [Xylographa opegraphella]|nr:hypothetical protein [Xylographa opegraphella]
MGFLDYPSSPRLYICAEGLVFDEKIMSDWKDEGFNVLFLPYNGTSYKTHYIDEVNDICSSLNSGEQFAIVGYGAAAAVILDACSTPIPKLSTVIAYYPAELPKTSAGYPQGLDILLHTVGTQKKIPGCKSYVYPHVDAGFAEAGRGTYDKVSAGLAWSRTLGVIRSAFGIQVDLEEVWENHLTLEFAIKDADATMKTMVAEPYVNHIPTLTGGIGHKDLLRFYKDFFIPGNPPSMTMRLISRTVGIDRVVDEMYVHFKHTQEIPWMLPGVAPTDMEVEVALVSVVCIRGGKLYHEHIYWDQATVLVQIGLLDPKLIPSGKSARRLPVVAAEGARKVVDENSVQSNGLIEGW